MHFREACYFGCSKSTEWLRFGQQTISFTLWAVEESQVSFSELFILIGQAFCFVVLNVHIWPLDWLCMSHYCNTVCSWTLTFNVCFFFFNLTNSVRRSRSEFSLLLAISGVYTQFHGEKKIIWLRSSKRTSSPVTCRYFQFKMLILFKMSQLSRLSFWILQMDHVIIIIIIHFRFVPSIKTGCSRLMYVLLGYVSSQGFPLIFETTCQCCK